MSEPSGVVSFTTSPEESVRASRFLNQRIYRLFRLPPLITFALGLVILLLLGWPDGAPIAAALWAAGLLLLGFDRVLPVLGRRQLAARYPELFRQPTTVTIGESGLEVTRGAATTIRDWSGVTNYVENKEFLVLRDGRLPVLFVPKRAFADAAELTAFTAVVASHVPAGRAP